MTSAACGFEVLGFGIEALTLKDVGLQGIFQGIGAEGLGFRIGV